MNAALKTRLFAIVTVVVGMFVQVVSVGSASTPTRYRYTGLAGPAAQPAGHYIVEGDGIKLFFADQQAPPSGTAYRVCVSRVNQCWNRHTRLNNYTDSFIIGNFARPKYGAMTARWYVGGRVVAVWNFYYSPEGD